MRAMDAPRTDGERAGDDGGTTTFALLAGLVLLTVPLVGCADGGGPSPSGEAMTARDGLGDAEAAAQDWSEDAVFIGAATLETTNETPEDWAPDAPEFQADDEIGDGMAPQWSYSFKSSDDERVNIFVTAGGETYQHTPQQEDFFMGSEIEDWEISSPDAVDAAKEEIEDFEQTADADDAEVGVFLGAGDSGQVGWILDAQSDEMDQQVTVSVDANTGDVQRFGGPGTTSGS